MSEARQLIPIDQIHVPENRLRPMDEGAARALARLIEREGQLSPIAVYRSNASSSGKPFTLIYGARRHRALQILGWSEIEATLRKKAEAAILEITDNLNTSGLDPLEEAEHFVAYREWWEGQHGPIERGGDRKSNRRYAGLVAKNELREKRSFYKEITDIYGYSERKALLLLRIGRMHSGLRDALRGTKDAKNQTRLVRLSKYGPTDQARIAARYKAEPDLDAALRAPDPETSREGVGRMDRTQWLEMHLVEHLSRMAEEQRDAALSRLGYMRKPFDALPSHLPPVRVVPAPGNRSPLWAALRDPMSLAVAMSYEEIMAWKELYRAEEIARHVADQVNEREAEGREAYNAQRAKAKAASRRGVNKRGRPVDPPAVKREKAFRKWFVPELADNLLQQPEAEIGHRVVKYCRRLNEAEQFWAATHLANEHHLEDVPPHIEWKREREVAATRQDRI